MRNNYVLIDYENVQPTDFSKLAEPHFLVKLFLGMNQAKIPVELACALQPLGARVEYIRIEAAGPNALDFCIAYHLGLLTERDPHAYFHIISKDAGFDPLVKLLRSRKIGIARCSDLHNLPCFKLPPAKKAPVLSKAPPIAPSAPKSAIAEDVERAIEHLKNLKAARPRKLETVKSSLKSLFKDQRTPEQIDEIATALIAQNTIQCDGSKSVVYSF